MLCSYVVFHSQFDISIAVMQYSIVSLIFLQLYHSIQGYDTIQSYIPNMCACGHQQNLVCVRVSLLQKDEIKMNRHYDIPFIVYSLYIHYIFVINISFIAILTKTLFKCQILRQKSWPWQDFGSPRLQTDHSNKLSMRFQPQMALLYIISRLIYSCNVTLSFWTIG